MRENKFQTSVTTGRMTLPGVIFFYLSVWMVSLDSWKDLATLGIAAFTGYLMIEANTAFTLIRTRTTLPVAFYWTLFSGLVFLHGFGWDSFTPVVFLLATMHLMRSYESSHAPAHVFHSFFFLALGSWGFPPLLWLGPLFFFSTHAFRSLSLKTFFASLLGVAAPYWLLFGYAYLTDEMSLFLAPLNEVMHFRAVGHSLPPLHEIISWGVIFVWQMVCNLHYFQVSYQDKTRTRVYLTFLAICGWWVALLILLQPHHIHAWLPVQLLCTSFLAAHLFTLTRNRFSGLFFIVTFVGIILLTGYNVWMQFFNS